MPVTVGGGVGGLVTSCLGSLNVDVGTTTGSFQSTLKMKA